MKIKLHLSNGTTFVAEFCEDELDSVHEQWHIANDKIAFDNGVFRAKDIIGMEYME